MSENEVDSLSVASSDSMIRTEADVEAIAGRVAAALGDQRPPSDTSSKVSPAFAELREPKLPTLGRQNRAWLQMQTPTRMYFYWSLGEDPYKKLRSVLGDGSSSYTLVLRLLDITHDRETLNPVGAEGNWWFNADPDTAYRAEIGFFAPDRPFIRALYSNTVTTPRSEPSPRVAEDGDWVITADRFATVLDAAGFKRDAVEVARAGDDPAANEEQTRKSFGSYFKTPIDFRGYSAEDLRYALSRIAAGEGIESLRWSIGPTLFAILEENAETVTSARAAAALKEQLGSEEYIIVEEELSAVYGASLVNFRRTMRRRLPSLRAHKFSSVSSSGGIPDRSFSE